MKKLIWKISLLGVMATAISGCTDNFDTMNKNPLTADKVSPDLILPEMQDKGFNNNSWEFQVGPNLHANLYAQYIANTTTFYTTAWYGYNNAWVNDGYWKPYYVSMAKYYHLVKAELETRPDYTYMFQVMRIICAMGAARTTDIFGDVPYFDAGKGADAEQPKYDSQKEIYYDLFKELTEAVAVLQSNLSNQRVYGEEDLFYAGDWQKWIRLANSLRLRYAIRLAFVDPDKAKLEGEAALKEELMVSNEDNAAVRNSSLDQGHCYWIISYWNEFRMSKMMENVLTKSSTVADPRMVMWFSQTQGWVNGSYDVQFQGVPSGILATKVNQKDYLPENNSCIWGLNSFPYWNQAQKGSKATTPSGIVVKPMVLMNYGEVCQLKAEAAIRGWANAGDAKANYENGIRASIAESRQGVNTSLYSTAEDETYITTGDVKWDASAGFEDQLKRIVTQKWLAIYPNGEEGWSEYRRSGYPELMPIETSLEPTIKPSAGESIKKLRYIDEELRGNTAHATAAELNQGQGDGMNVRVWWDTKRYK